MEYFITNQLISTHVDIFIILIQQSLSFRSIVVGSGVFSNQYFLAVTPGQANYVLDGSNEDDVLLSAWHITYADYGKLTNVLAKQPDVVVNATLSPAGKLPLIQFGIYSSILQSASQAEALNCITSILPFMDLLRLRCFSAQSRDSFVSSLP